MGKSMDYCKRGPLTKTPDFSDQKQKDLYESSKEYREHLKKKGVTYDAKTGKSTTKTNTSEVSKEKLDKVATKKPEKMEKMPTLGPKKLSTGSYTREHNEYKDHTSKIKAIQPK
tara:strand:+ start:813 stop:1154 length:342 start_codon:yes stop_codon:yes gene_type:complete